MISKSKSKSILIYIWLWAITNLLVGIWEIYIYNERSQLSLSKTTLWDKFNSNQINLRNFWIEGWSEYCKVDSRYIIKPYVWVFELLNAFLAILFIIALGCKSYNTLKIILLISIANCLLYFITLFWEVYYFQDARKNIITKKTNKKNTVLENIKNYSQWWMLPTYYLISAIWIIVPVWLYLSIS
jgi:hypothetical protein